MLETFVARELVKHLLTRLQLYHKPILTRRRTCVKGSLSVSFGRAHATGVVCANNVESRSPYRGLLRDLPIILRPQFRDYLVKTVQLRGGL